MIALLWSALMAAMLVCLHYAKSTLVVEIHWKDGDYEDPLSNQVSQRSRRALNFFDEDLNSTKRYTKLEHLPVQTLESLNRNCSDPLCLEYLSKTERAYYNKCKQKAISMEFKFGQVLKTGKCKFQNGTERYPVALASFPGSGNTWVRGLLEKVTGICTGEYQRRSDKCVPLWLNNFNLQINQLKFLLFNHKGPRLSYLLWVSIILCLVVWWCHTHTHRSPLLRLWPSNKRFHRRRYPWS